MTPLVPLTLFGWIPFVLYLYQRIPPQRAVAISFVVAWLFLPEAGYPLPGLPDYTKMSATCYGILLATLLYDAGRLTRFRLHLIDAPILCWCFSPFMSSMTNGLGVYDGFAATVEQTVSWGLPYLLGRLYLNNWESLKFLAIAIFAGGLSYVPLCAIELVISPQLHRIFYGFHAARFDQAIRYGGYRPTVFMNHGLAVGAWMMAATLVAYWLWQSGVLKKFLGVPMKTLFGVLVVMLVLVKSTGAYALFVFGVLCLWLIKRFKQTILILVLTGGLVFYLWVAASGAITPENRVEYMTRLEQIFPPDRVASLNFRMENEEILSEKARERPLFGWGGWGRARVYNDEGEDISVTDSLWIIAFGNHGTFGLVSLYATFLVPILAFCWSGYHPRTWSNPTVAPTAVLAVVLLLFMIDCALNAMPNPVYTLSCGALAGLVAAHPPIQARRRKPPKRRRIPPAEQAEEEEYAIAQN